MLTHCLGYPRLGPNREYKFAVEQYWRGETGPAELAQTRRELIHQQIQAQAEAGLDLVTVGDFSWYDPLADWALSLGFVPERFRGAAGTREDLLFYMARGTHPAAAPTRALKLRKWFGTNYHYLVPELPEAPVQPLDLSTHLEVLALAQRAQKPVKVVIPGPLTLLGLSDPEGPGDRASRLAALIARYQEALALLTAAGADWIQVDEPLFSQDLAPEWLRDIEPTYHALQRQDVQLMLTVSYGAPTVPLATLTSLPVAALHLDALADADTAKACAERLPPHRALSLGLVNGRSVWATDVAAHMAPFIETATRLQDRLLVGTTTSLQHLPWDLASEQALTSDQKARLAFARQKLEDVIAVRDALQGAVTRWPDNGTSNAESKTAERVVKEEVAAEARPSQAMLTRTMPRSERLALQKSALGLPVLPTTTIGSFPQTDALRSARARWRKGELDQAGYNAVIQTYLEHCIRTQEDAGVDVLVHGEPERTDMVEFFAQYLAGVWTTQAGWVQSYGSRCVKPPVIADDVRRRSPMTVDMYQRAQALTSRPVKGMLTGPVTLLNWSFVREDIPRSQVAFQLALAVREEVADLEAAGARIIQVDEPALREGLPLRKAEQPAYLDWATTAFRLATAVARPDTQIHTHMCYATFGDVLEAIEAMDADVITLETSRAQGELLEHLAKRPYPAEIGPGVWDVHSPAVPDTDQLVAFILRLLTVIPAHQLWINPDCGLKTRRWEEVIPSLKNMVEAARRVRVELAEQAQDAPGNAHKAEVLS